MKNSWLVYVAVAAISALAGVAIAGPPNTVGTDATIVVPETTTVTTTAPATTVAPPTTAAEPEEATAANETSSSTTTSSTTTTSTEPEIEIDRAGVAVVSVNGAGVGGLATRVRDELRDLGFVQTRSGDGTEFVDDTVVYFVEGFAAEAVDVAGALGLEFADVKPIEEAPAFGVIDDDQVVVYLGRDRA